MGRSDQVGSSFPRHEWEIWTQQAQKEGMNTTKWLRKAAMQALANEAENVDQPLEAVA